MNTDQLYLLRWDFVHAGEPIPSDLVFFGILAVALAVLIVRSVVSRRIQRRTGNPPRIFRRVTLVAVAVLVVSAVVAGATMERSSHYRSHQQAAFVEAQLGVRVPDDLQFPGLHTALGDVQLLVPTPSTTGAETLNCELSTHFYDKHGAVVASKPGRGEGDGHMQLAITCPEPIATPQAQKNQESSVAG